MNAMVGIVNTPSSRLLRAVVYGHFAALVGGLVSFLASLPGYNVSVLAIAVGWMVGTAVATGSYRHGGWFYRTLAVGLTYLAVGASLAPALYVEMQTPRPGIDLYVHGDNQALEHAFKGQGRVPAPPMLSMSEEDRRTDSVVAALVLPCFAVPIDSFRRPLSGLAYVTALFVAAFRSRRGVLESARSRSASPAGQ
ncbi:hypothetical protein [Corallococcus exercitus]|uniref:Uncharacterized protein n=1 Tax=Corallococcus exercitus TaxID=2316736 RepID=A0A7Y4JX09_9BACT|nr:hypothetical protein [Corallococcus exercitus]NOK12363.1 hypothetical protein [Corallococcus exercitus]